MERREENVIFLSAHRCPDVDALPHHDFVSNKPLPCSLVPVEKSSSFTCAGDSETNYLDVSPSCGFDKEEDEEEERSVSDWSEEDLSLHFTPSVILRSDDDESDPESGFECIDITMETLVQGQKGEGLKMVPKRQIQLKKKKDVKNAEKLQVKPTDMSSEVGGTYSEVLCPPVRPDVFRRQHSMPASLPTSSHADSYRVCRGLVAGASQGVDGGETSRLWLQKSFSLDETKTKVASCIIKSILSKKMQVEKTTCKSSVLQNKETVLTGIQPQSTDQQRVSQEGRLEASFPTGKTGAGVFKTPVHVVRDMRSLVKNTYGLSFSTTTPEIHSKPTRFKVIGQEQSPPPTYQQAVGVGQNETQKSRQASAYSNSYRGHVAKVAASLSQPQDRNQSEHVSCPITLQRRGSEPVIRSKADDVTWPVVLLDESTKQPVSRNLSGLSQSERARGGSHQTEASLFIPPPPSMLLQQQGSQPNPSSQEQSSILALSSHFAPSSSQQILQPCFYPAQLLPIYSHTLQPQMGKVSYVSAPLSYIHVQPTPPASTCHLLRRSEKTQSPENSPDHSQHFYPPQQPGLSVAQVSEGSTVTPTSQGQHDQQHPQQQLPQQKYLCNLHGVLPTQTGSDFMADFTGSAAVPRTLMSSYAHRHFSFDTRRGRCLLLDTPPTHQRKMLLDPETGQYVHVLLPKSSSTQNSSLVPVCSTKPTPIILTPTPSLINPAPTFMSVMHLQPTMAMSSLYSSPRLLFPPQTLSANSTPPAL